MRGQTPNKVKITNKFTGESNVYDSTMEASKAIGKSYLTINYWINGRTKSQIYDACYVYDV